MFALTFSNPWIAAVDTARRRYPGWLVAGAGLALAAGVIFGGGGLEGIADAALAKLPAPAAAYGLAASPVLFVFLPLLAIAVLAARLEGRALFRSGKPIAHLALGLALGGGGFGLAMAILALAGVLRPGHGGPTGEAALAGVAAGAVLTALQAGAEEVYFRGWIQPVLCARWGPWLGLTTTSLLFAALHQLGGLASPLCLLNTVLAGLGFGLIALRFGAIWAPIAAHTAWNWVEAYGLGTDPNPGVGALGSLVDLDMVGPALWSGGAESLNGSLAATLSLGLMIMLLVAWPARSRTGPDVDRARAA